jgi:6-pyruvoyl-tetrahydropterin synthase
MATLFVDNLTVLDFSYLHAKRGMVGESWIVDLELSGDLDDHNMVFDFSHVKRIVKETIDQALDHRLLVPADSEQGEVEYQGEEVRLEWHYEGGVIRLAAPEQSVFLLPSVDVSKGAVTRHLISLVHQILPPNVHEVLIRLREENVGTCPYYHYSHGLRHHEGNCQRIAHGHRSRIEIRENGRRSRYWEKLWADRWEDIYLGSREDLEGTYFIDEVPHHRFRYESSQGRFELVIPEDHCYLLDTDTTVELLAQHLAGVMARETNQSCFRVRAFEGIGKGAVAEAGESRLV